MSFLRGLPILVPVAFAFSLCADDVAPAPELASVEPFVVRIAETNLLTLQGKHLDGLHSIWTSRHGIILVKQDIVTADEEGKHVTVKLDVDDLTACGPFALRVITDGGISDPQMGFLETLPDLLVGEDRLITGTGFENETLGQPDGISFQTILNKDENLSIEVLAGQFGSQLDPVLAVRDSRGREVEYVHDSRGMGVDCSLTFTAPYDDNYSIVLRDARYESGDRYRYHLRLGTQGSGMASSYVHSDIHNEVFAFSGGARVPDSPDYAGRKRQFIESEMQQKSIGAMFAPSPHHPSYRLDAIATYPIATLWGSLNSTHEQFLKPQSLAGSSLNGWFTKPDELTRLKLLVREPGSYRWVAISRRLGSHSDPAMRLTTLDGDVITESHLFRNESVLQHQFTDSGDYMMEIWDLAGQFGDNTHYHVQAQVDPAEFELITESDSLRIEPGGSADLKVDIQRDRYQGPVMFAITTELEGVELSDNIAKRSSKEATIKVALADSLTPGSTFPLKISGHRGDSADAPRAPLYTQAYWKKAFPNLYSPMFEFEDTIWVTVLPEQKADETAVKPEDSEESER